MSETKPTVTVSASMKVQIAPFEMAEVFVSLNSLSTGTTEDEMKDLMDTGQIAYSMIKRHVLLKAQALKLEGKPKPPIRVTASDLNDSKNEGNYSSL